MSEPVSAPWFEETQRFTQPWLWLVILAVAGFSWYAALLQLGLRRPVGSNPAPDAVLLVVWLLFGVALPLLFRAMHLRTEVKADGLHLRLYPLHLRFRHWPFEALGSADARTYSPLREYGGWGLRLGPGGWAYNIQGNRGVQIVLRSGRRILIGSQEPERLEDALRRGIAADATTSVETRG